MRTPVTDWTGERGSWIDGKEVKAGKFTASQQKTLAPQFKDEFNAGPSGAAKGKAKANRTAKEALAGLNDVTPPTPKFIAQSRKDSLKIVAKVLPATDPVGKQAQAAVDQWGKLSVDQQGAAFASIAKQLDARESR